MKTLIYSSHDFERPYFNNANLKYQHDLKFVEAKLDINTSSLSMNYPCICTFVSDDLSEPVLKKLAENGTKIIALRSKGYDHIDLKITEALGIKVLRVPYYSAYSIAEFALGMILSLNRKIYKSYNRTREGNFSLDGLVGFDLHGKTIGVVGTGEIGKCFIKIMLGFGCKVLAFDSQPDQDFAKQSGIEYCSKEVLFSESDIISLHVPLNSGTRHIINILTLSMMKKNVMLINTGRGGLIDTKELLAFLKNGKIGSAAIDVYENEKDYFFKNNSNNVLKDDLLARLLTFPNVLVTGHQAFLTSEALTDIADTTLQNIAHLEQGLPDINEVKYES